ncbi:dipeptide epimerase [Maribacter polysaccharolyticus]|uniref:dipeptide epimerase n=1 Tax=Maribacter polysaccharolyticus TaxID=3020831 RepID=UPI00237F3C16|nr:dipeptide epimerase [Maribacter polysaccharolyticus]MDE3740469.1 dipeptide epimerase [Maribacter polysaccharolyticus]
MELTFKIIHLKKRFPLQISRGVITGTNNLFVGVTKNGITGWGEMAPSATLGNESAEESQKVLEQFYNTGIADLSITEIYKKGREFGLPLCVLAALDIALWDQLAKAAQLPLYKLFGIPLPKVATSVTIGINPPEVVKERMPLLLEGTGVKFLKVKLGSKEGIEADKAMFAQVIESTKKYNVGLRVDANGGWDVDQAIHMMKWLADLGTDYVEQPLVHGQEEDLPFIFKNRPLPIFVDESCNFSTDIPQWAHSVDGVNLKLMKCGGLTEGLRIIATAKAFNLKTMIGCMGESSLSISAGAAITGLLDHVDLDSHLNLNPDPFSGAQLIDGVVMPTERFGHGAILKDKL